MAVDLKLSFQDMLPWENTEYFNCVLCYAKSRIWKWVLLITKTIYTLQMYKIYHPETKFNNLIIPTYFLRL